MKERFIDFIEKFYKFMETKEFNHENEDDRKIVQKRINMMMDSSLMQEWIKPCLNISCYDASVVFCCRCYFLGLLG